MFIRIFRRLRSDEQGVTLPELLIVVICIGVLAAVIIPRLLGTQQTTKDGQAKQAARAALTGARQYYGEHNDAWSGLTLAALRSYEPSISPTAAPAAATPSTSTDSNAIYLAKDNAGGALDAATNVVYLCSAPSSGKRAYCIADNGTNTAFKRGSDSGNDSIATVVGTTAPFTAGGVPTNGWASSW